MQVHGWVARHLVFTGSRRARLGQEHLKPWMRCIHWLRLLNPIPFLDRMLPVFHPLHVSGWSFFMLLMTVCVVVIVPLQIGFVHLRELATMRALDWATTSSFLVDVIVQFRTGYITSTGEVMRDSRLIAIHYMRGLFVLDLVSALPYQAVSNYGAQELVWLGLLKLPRMVRLSRSANVGGHSRYGNVLAVAQLLVAMMLAIHASVCVWHYLSETRRDWPWAFDACSNCDSATTTYLFGFYMAFLLLMGDRPSARNDMERVLVICLLFLGAFFYASVVGMMTLLVSNVWAVASRHKQRAAMLDDALRYRGASHEVRDRVGEYFDHLAQYQHPGSDGVAFLQELPLGLYGTVMATMFGPRLARVQLFAHCERPFLWRLAQRLRLSLYMAGDVIYELGSVGHDMYIIWKGAVGLVARDGCVAALLADGEHFGELGLMTASSPRPHRAVALRPCDVVLLGRWDLQDAMKDFPESAALVKERARSRVEDHEAASSNLWAATAGMMGLGLYDGSGTWVNLIEEDDEEFAGDAIYGSVNSVTGAASKVGALPLGVAEASPSGNGGGGRAGSDAERDDAQRRIAPEGAGGATAGSERKPGHRSRVASACGHACTGGTATGMRSSLSGGSAMTAGDRRRGAGPLAEARELPGRAGSAAVQPPTAALTGRFSSWFARGLRSSVQQQQQPQHLQAPQLPQQQRQPQHGTQHLALTPATGVLSPRARASTRSHGVSAVPAGAHALPGAMSPAGPRSLDAKSLAAQQQPQCHGPSSPVASVLPSARSAAPGTCVQQQLPLQPARTALPSAAAGLRLLPRWLRGAPSDAAPTQQAMHPASAAAGSPAAAGAGAVPAGTHGGDAAAAEGSSRLPLQPSNDRLWSDLMRVVRSPTCSTNPSAHPTAAGLSFSHHSHAGTGTGADVGGRNSFEAVLVPPHGSPVPSARRVSRQQSPHHHPLLHQQQGLHALLSTAGSSSVHSGPPIAASHHGPARQPTVTPTTLLSSGDFASAAHGAPGPASATNSSAAATPDMRARGQELLGPEVCQISDALLAAMADTDACPTSPPEGRQGAGRTGATQMWIDSLLQELENPGCDRSSAAAGGAPLLPGSPTGAPASGAAARCARADLQPPHQQQQPQRHSAAQLSSPRGHARVGSRGHARANSGSLGPQFPHTPSGLSSADGVPRAVTRSTPAHLLLRRGGTTDCLVSELHGPEAHDDTSIRSAMSAMPPASPDVGTAARRRHRLRQSTIRTALQPGKQQQQGASQGAGRQGLEASSQAGALQQLQQSQRGSNRRETFVDRSVRKSGEYVIPYVRKSGEFATATARRSGEHGAATTRRSGEYGPSVARRSGEYGVIPGRRSGEYGILAWVREASAAGMVGATSGIGTPVTGWRPAQGRQSVTGLHSRNSSRSGYRPAAAVAAVPDSPALTAGRSSTGGIAPASSQAGRRRRPVRRNSTASLRRGAAGATGGGGGGGSVFSEGGSDLSDGWSDGSGGERRRGQCAALQRRLAESQAALASVLADPLKVPAIAAVVRREVEAVAARLAEQMDKSLRSLLEEVTGATARVEDLSQQAGVVDERLQRLEEAGTDGAGIGGDSVLGVQLRPLEPAAAPRMLSHSGSSAAEAAQLSLRMLASRPTSASISLLRQPSGRRASQVLPSPSAHGILKHASTSSSPPETPSGTALADHPDRGGPGRGSSGRGGTPLGGRPLGGGSVRRRSDITAERLPPIIQTVAASGLSVSVRAVGAHYRNWRRSLELPASLTTGGRLMHAPAVLPATTSNTPDSSVHGGAGRRVHRLSSLGFALRRAVQARAEGGGGVSGGGGIGGGGGASGAVSGGGGGERDRRASRSSMTSEAEPSAGAQRAAGGGGTAAALRRGAAAPAPQLASPPEATKATADSHAQFTVSKEIEEEPDWAGSL